MPRGKIITTPVGFHRNKMIGEKIKACRKLADMTQNELADLLGITFQQIQKYEKGVNRITAVRLLEISEVLQVPIMEFYNDLITSTSTACKEYQVISPLLDNLSNTVNHTVKQIASCLNAPVNNQLPLKNTQPAHYGLK